MPSQATKDFKTILAANVRRARDARGITQRDLAAQVNGVDSLAVSRWERGVAVPNPENMQALAQALGVDVGWLYTDHDSEPLPDKAKAA